MKRIIATLIDLPITGLDWLGHKLFDYEWVDRALGEPDWYYPCLVGYLVRYDWFIWVTEHSAFWEPAPVPPEWIDGLDEAPWYDEP